MLVSESRTFIKKNGSWLPGKKTTEVDRRNQEGGWAGRKRKMHMISDRKTGAVRDEVLPAIFVGTINKGRGCTVGPGISGQGGKRDQNRGVDTYSRGKSFPAPIFISQTKTMTKTTIYCSSQLKAPPLRECQKYQG